MNRERNSSKERGEDGKSRPLGSGSRDKDNSSSDKTSKLKRNGSAIVGRNISSIKANRLQRSGSVSTIKERSFSSRSFPKQTVGALDGKNSTPHIQSRGGGARSLIERSAPSTNPHRNLHQSKADLTGNETYFTASSVSVYHSAATSHDGLSLGRLNVQSSKNAPLTGLKRKALTSSIRSDSDTSSNRTYCPNLVARKAPLPTVQKMMASDLSSIGNTTEVDKSMPSRALTSSDTSVSASKRFRGRSFSKEDFILGRPLGKGRFGLVRLAKERESGFICAIKLLCKKEILRNSLERPTQREININGAANNPNILQIYTSFADDKFIYLVTEYAAQGELFSKLKSVDRFSEDIAAKYIVQVINALNHLHANHIIHRDLKPENILLSHDDRVLLADFGWAVQTKSQRKTIVGTPDYIAPELVDGREYGPGADCWALGVLAYELLVGSPPFEVAHDEPRYLKTYARIARVDLKFPNYVSPLAKDFITRLLKKNQYERMFLIDAAKHEWLISFAGNS